jgi:hypothetical protein
MESQTMGEEEHLEDMNVEELRILTNWKSISRYSIPEVTKGQLDVTAGNEEKSSTTEFF